MHKPNTGRLLKRVAYALRKEIAGKNITGDPIKVRDAFPYDPSSRTAPKSALRWATGFRRGNEPEYVPDVVERDNDPFTVTITDLEGRGNGGRAYKVIDGSMRRFDLREDQLMEILRDVGIMPGGAVNGTFVWGLAQSQLRLVMVGGKLYQAMVAGAQTKDDFDARDAAGDLYEASRLIVGHVYKKRDGTLYAYLGSGSFPGQEKALHAFVQMPTQPEMPDLTIDPSWLPEDRKKTWHTCQRERADLIGSWSDMTWERRCQYDWQDQYRNYDGSARSVYDPDPIVLMSTPKFDLDVGVLEPAFLSALRSNKHGVHRYVKSVRNGDDVVFRWNTSRMSVTEAANSRWSGADYARITVAFANAIVWHDKE